MLRLPFLFMVFMMSNLLNAQEGQMKIINSKGRLPFVADIQLNDRLTLEVVASLPNKELKSPMTIYNGKEIYSLNVKKILWDTVIYQFPAQDAEWRIAFDKDLVHGWGWWINYNKNTPVRYPIHISRAMLDYSSHEQNNIDLSGKWQIVFNPGSDQEEILIGVFEQSILNNLIGEPVVSVMGSFLSETGDYRYLHGHIKNNKLHLQTYTGYWAFVVDAMITGKDQFEGTFYSGAKYHVPFIAKRDSTIKLKDESSLTYLIKRDEPVYLTDLIKLNGRKMTFNPVASGKITLIQIMGTWCPNCLDETQMLLELQNEYGKEALNVIALAYEVGSDTKKQRKRLKNWVKSMSVSYPVYLAGTSSKESASSHFPMLNGIMSFPTTLLLDQQGKIIAIHTGFSGPATGNAYTELIEKYRQEIEGALEEIKH